MLVEENALAGGFGSAVLELFNETGAIQGKTVKLLGIPDEFIEHGTQSVLRHLVGIDKNGMKKTLKKMCKA